uniref:Uncharacterized protein n=1 Tax=Anopheles dirus TaxID=7168 RepID=A0A182NWA0_9DIPT
MAYTLKTAGLRNVLLQRTDTFCCPSDGGPVSDGAPRYGSKIIRNFSGCKISQPTSKSKSP